MFNLSASHVCGFRFLYLYYTQNFNICQTKNLYKIILTCGEFEEPYIDEHNIEIVINDEKKLMSLIKKYDKINEEYFQNKLVFKTFNLDDKKYIQELIKVLKNSIEHN